MDTLSAGSEDFSYLVNVSLTASQPRAQHLSVQPKQILISQTDITTEGSTAVWIIDDLLPGFNYDMVMTVISDGKSSPSSEVFTCATLDGVAVSAPENVTAELSMGSVTVSWSPPPTSTWNGNITQYRIRYDARALPTTTCSTALFLADITVHNKSSHVFTVSPTTRVLFIQVAALTNRSSPAPGPYSECTRVYSSSVLESTETQSSSNTGVVIGAVVGGLVLVLVLVAVSLFVWSQSRRRRGRIDSFPSMTSSTDTAIALSADLMAFEIGREQLSLSDELGRGQFGSVFLADCVGLPRATSTTTTATLSKQKIATVAVKFLNEKSTSVQDREVFMLEAHRMCKLDHRHVVRLLDSPLLSPLLLHCFSVILTKIPSDDFGSCLLQDLSQFYCAGVYASRRPQAELEDSQPRSQIGQESAVHPQAAVGVRCAGE
eukprot:m.381871 g.381871  ORF g.381871 m.381871 type:complete len:433 (+) comp56242_c0_seq80:803-2101(+)